MSARIQSSSILAARMSNGAAQIPLFKVFMAPEAALLPRLREVLYSGQISEGAPVAEFEQRFGAFVGQPHMLSFYSGPAALHIALLLARAGPGDEVISTAMTAEPTNLAIVHAGARVVWADVDPRNGNLAAAAIAEKITPRTRAILAVHYGGIPASMAAIRAVAERHGVALIEDAAHALGARYAGLPIGSQSENAMYSLQAIKHLTTVDGGMLACRNPDALVHARRPRRVGIHR